jgi:single-stranded-DNA-specific exonuclease
MSGPADARWRLPPPDREVQTRLAAALGVAPLIAQVLVNRGARDLEAARAFLDPALARLAPPFALDGMERAVDRIVRAIGAREQVAVYGDYDADGVTAAAQLVRTLRGLGAAVTTYVPDRLSEGYGLHEAAVRRLVGAGASLVVAVDCGTTAVGAARATREAGADLVILDHHLPAGTLPDAAAIVNPRLTDGAPEFCAAGLAFQACRAILAACGREADAEPLVVLAALGTVADAVPLLGDNRCIVGHALLRGDWHAPAGLRALLAVAGLQQPLSARDLSHALAPRLNAAGRLAHAATALRLLTTDDPGECAALAAALDGLNAERRALCDRAVAEAVEEIEAGGLASGPAIVLAHEGWHPGVVGIVASQLVDRYYRPVVLIALQDGLGRGSARSIPPLHLVDALTRASADLVAFGGHAMAAGLTVRAEAIPRFRDAFVAAVGGLLRPQDLEPVVGVDAEISLADITPALAAELARLAPHGAGQPPPMFLTRGVRAVGTRLVGGGAHLRLVVSDGNATADAIGFRLGERAEILAFTQARIDLAYTVEYDRWRDAPAVQLVVDALWTPDVDPAAVATDVEGVLERLFERTEDYLDDRHAHIEEADAFHTKVVGVTFGDRQRVLAGVRAGERLRLVRDPGNPHDPHAVQVCRADGRQVGFLRAALAARLAPAMDAGARYAASATSLTGGGDRPWGLNIHIRREALWAGDAEPSGTALGAARSRQALIDHLAATVYRGRPLSATQREILSAVAGDVRMVARVGPGGGLVAISALAAAALVARVGRPVAVVLPRASEADAWAAAAGPWLRQLGLRAAAAHGAPPVAARTWGTQAGPETLDVMFASAEWFAATRPTVAAVVGIADEEADPVRGQEGAPDRFRLVLGPFSDAQLSRLAARMGLEVGPTGGGPRVNLRVVDRRGRPGPDLVLPGAHERPEHPVVLAADPRGAVAAALELRAQAREGAGRIAYYHAGLPSALRRVLEDLFSAGSLRAVVAGSLFVHPSAPPDVSRVVALGLASTRLLATEGLGVAGLGGRPAVVELAFGAGAPAAATAAVERRHPSRETLVRCYHYLKDLDRQGAWSVPQDGAPGGLAPETLAAAVDVFLEAGVVAVEDGEGAAARFALVDPAGRYDLERSLRYREGVRERAAAERLRAWAEGPASAILASLAAER